ncbi:hypothetical protein [Phyllobacterium myrsinacearum]|uniref:Uncharacterized protein n=1 Tax=Phyllobacterium myrsinacearum TaxID=28101 RepID=A0A839ENP1_9HYPH|nr:hypothetical protein [Phyllobacterium myrsinacearum]MBA8878280.1 hypothetical protein [Phyllobacterium myrsinacearum]
MTMLTFANTAKAEDLQLTLPLRPNVEYKLGDKFPSFEQMRIQCSTTKINNYLPGTEVENYSVFRSDGQCLVNVYNILQTTPCDGKEYAACLQPRLQKMFSVDLKVVDTEEVMCDTLETCRISFTFVGADDLKLPKDCQFYVYGLMKQGENDDTRIIWVYEISVKNECYLG